MITDFKHRARKHLFNSELREFPVVLELYLQAFRLEVDSTEVAAKVYEIVRASENQQTAFELVCHYLDSLEDR